MAYHLPASHAVAASESYTFSSRLPTMFSICWICGNLSQPKRVQRASGISCLELRPGHFVSNLIRLYSSRAKLRR